MTYLLSWYYRRWLMRQPWSVRGVLAASYFAVGLITRKHYEEVVNSATGGRP
jgi:hypothetical protein